MSTFYIEDENNETYAVTFSLKNAKEIVEMLFKKDCTAFSIFEKKEKEGKKELIQGFSEELIQSFSIYKGEQS